MIFVYLCREMLAFLKNILQLIISPDNGWEDVVRVSSPRRAMRCMAWIVAVAAMSVFIQLLYSVHNPVMVLCQRSVIIVVSLWATYFIGDFIMTQWLPRINDGMYDERLSWLLPSYAASLLSLQVILTNVLPLTFAILELWPIYVVIIMWRAMKVLELPEGATGKYLLVIIVAFIVPSQLLPRLFNMVIMQ